VKELESSLQAFRQHPLQDEYEALIVDGMYVRLRQCGETKAARNCGPGSQGGRESGSVGSESVLQRE